jgi:hypothetical protein
LFVSASGHKSNRSRRNQNRSTMITNEENTKTMKKETYPVNSSILQPFLIFGHPSIESYDQWNVETIGSS